MISVANSKLFRNHLEEKEIGWTVEDLKAAGAWQPDLPNGANFEKWYGPTIYVLQRGGRGREVKGLQVDIDFQANDTSKKLRRWRRIEGEWRCIYMGIQGWINGVTK